jgi:hypothetical protein
MKHKATNYSSGPLVSVQGLTAEALHILTNNPAGSYKYIVAVLTDAGELHFHLYRAGRSYKHVHSVAFRQQAKANCPPAEYYWVAGPCQRRGCRCGGGTIFVRFFYRRHGYKSWTMSDFGPFVRNDHASILGALGKEITIALFLLSKGPRPEREISS